MTLRSSITFQVKEFVERLMGKTYMLETKELLFEQDVHHVRKLHIIYNFAFIKFILFINSSSAPFTCLVIILVRHLNVSVPIIGDDEMEGKSIGYIFSGSSLAGIFSLSDVCRTGVKEAIQELKLMGIKSAMLTGDHQAAAKHAQHQVILIQNLLKIVESLTYINYFVTICKKNRTC